MQDLYSKLGASSAKEDVHAAIQNLDKGMAPGAFCKVLPDIFGQNPDMLCAVHADGAGTKSILAYLYWRETGDLSVWKSISQDALVMNIDDLLCIGATGGFVVSSTLGRNKRLIPAEVIKALIEGTEEFCELLRSLGVDIQFAGGETADVGDLVKTIMVDSTVACRFPKNKLIEASNIKAGNVIVGLTSYGKTTYEDEYNSGIASNGLTLARHVLLKHQYALDFPESIDSHLVGNGGYTGVYSLVDSVLTQHKNLGKGILSPTRTFAPVIKTILEEVPLSAISGIIHNTGGAHSKVGKFISNTVSVEKEVNWEVPEIFQLIQKEAKINWKEMMQTFNCGLRMEFYCDENEADHILAIARSFEMDAMKIGKVKESHQKSVTLRSGAQEWTYS